MSFNCKRYDLIFQIKAEKELICKNYKVQLNLLNQKLIVNDERIKKLEVHKKI